MIAQLAEAYKWAVRQSDARGRAALTALGIDLARLRVASGARRRSGEEWVEMTNYFTVEVHGAQAWACEQYLGKGSRVLVDAELDCREWNDQQNHKREAVTLRARQVRIEGGRARPENGAASDDQNASPPSAHASFTAEQSQGRPTADDVPF
jgi:single stranded DNA-binding protein